VVCLEGVVHASTIETAFRFFIGHRLGRVDAFAHRSSEALRASRHAEPGAPPDPMSAYREWLEEYDHYERRARDDFVVHFREKYGPHLPIWVATEVMSFGLLSSLYDLMRQGDQDILAARFQIHAADGRGDRGPWETGSTTSGTWSAHRGGGDSHGYAADAWAAGGGEERCTEVLAADLSQIRSRDRDRTRPYEVLPRKQEFEAAVHEAEAMSAIVVPDGRRSV
jgi:hypothetical protein